MKKNIVFCFGQNWGRRIGGANSFEFSILKEILLLNKEKNSKFTVLTLLSNRKIINELNIKQSNITIKYYLTKKFSFIKHLKIFNYLSIHTLVNSLKPNYIICLGPYFINTNYNYSSIVWDISHLNSIRHYPEIISNNGIRMRDKRIKSICSNASHIFVGTNSLSEDITRFYRFPKSNILVNKMPLGNSYLKKEISLKREGNTIFYPAQIWPHKNHKKLIQAFSNCIKKKKLDKTWKLILVGSALDKKYFAKLTTLINLLSSQENIEFRGYVSDEDIKFLYKTCHAMIFPTLLGPDNIPPLEALSQNIFMSLSNLPGHIEQTSNQVDYHDANNINSIERAIIKLSKKSYKNFRGYNTKKLKSSRDYLKVLIKNAFETCEINDF